MALAIALLLLASCHVGPQIAESDLGQQPHGANLLVELKEKTGSKRIEYRGELLDVRDDGLVVAVDDDADNGIRVALIPWGRIYRASTTDPSGISVRTSWRESYREASTAELRNVSRFPQGLSPELTSRLLSHYGQSTLDTIE